MQEENSVSVEGVLDVSVIVPICFENPLQQEGVEFVKDVLLGKRKALLPTSALLGTYHIVTNYLGISRLTAKKVLTELLKTDSEALYPQISPDVTVDALDYASAFGVESWDGYLVALAKKFNARIVFSLDNEFKKKVKDLLVASPFDADKVREYHEFVMSESV